MKSMPNPIFSKLSLALFLLLIAAGTLSLTGCGGKKLVTRELKDYIASGMKITPGNVDVTLPFRTTIILRIPSMPLRDARQTGDKLIRMFIDYSKQNQVTDFLNDSLMFLVRLDVSPEVNLKYYTTASDMRELLDGNITDTDFIDRCVREENWSGDMG